MAMDTPVNVRHKFQLQELPKTESATPDTNDIAVVTWPAPGATFFQYFEVRCQLGHP
jgi:hypothetical protein